MLSNWWRVIFWWLVIKHGTTGRWITSIIKADVTERFFPWSLCLTFRLCVFRATPSLTASACPRWRKKTRACMSAVFLICGLMKVRILMFMLRCTSRWLTAWWLKRLCHTFRTVDHWGTPSQLWEVPHLGGPPLSLAKSLQEVKCQGWGSSGCLKSLSLVSGLPSYPPPQWPGHQLHPCQETQASSGSSMGLVSERVNAGGGWRWNRATVTPRCSPPEIKWCSSF